MHHERMNQPASKQQFEEVWEEDDGLKDEEFDPKTFFFLHGQTHHDVCYKTACRNISLQIPMVTRYWIHWSCRLCFILRFA